MFRGRAGGRGRAGVGQVQGSGGTRIKEAVGCSGACWAERVGLSLAEMQADVLFYSCPGKISLVAESVCLLRCWMCF